MREILFRGKMIDASGKKCDKWLYGDILTHNGIPTMHYETKVGPDTFGANYQVYAVGQYTGFNDKNGNKIFEGDILQFGIRHLLVYWNDEAFQWQCKTGLDNYSKCYDDCPLSMNYNKGWDNITLAILAAEHIVLGITTIEIIGNIWDSPDLIESNKTCEEIWWE